MGHLFQLFNLIRQSHRTEKQNLQVLESDIYVPRHRKNYDKDDLGQYNYVYFQFVSNGKKSHKYLVSSIDHRHDLKQITEELLRKKINVEVSESVVARFFNDVN